MLDNKSYSICFLENELDAYFHFMYYTKLKECLNLIFFNKENLMNLQDNNDFVLCWNLDLNILFFKKVSPNMFIPMNILSNLRKQIKDFSINTYLNYNRKYYDTFNELLINSDNICLCFNKNSRHWTTTTSYELLNATENCLRSSRYQLLSDIFHSISQIESIIWPSNRKNIKQLIFIQKNFVKKILIPNIEIHQLKKSVWKLYKY